MQDRVVYVLGGPVQPEVEERKRRGMQPKAEFNVFGQRNCISLVSTVEARGGHATSLRRRVALGWAVAGGLGGSGPVLASGEDIGFPVALASLLRRPRRPVCIILHGSLLEGRKFALAAPLLRRARNVHLLCLAESLRARLVVEHGFDPDRCHNAGYGVDTAFFAPAPPPDAPLIVSAGAANRDFATLVSASAGLGVPVRIAADSLWRPHPRPGGLQPAVPQLADKPALVEFGSAGDYVALRELYARATAVVVPLHPARHACGYAVIAEAMAMGRPVIATRTEAPSDLIVEGETGFIVGPGDVAGLRNRIALLLAQPGLARAMGAAGAARMREQFTLEAYCGRIEALIGRKAA